MLRMLFAYAIHVDPTAHLINVISIGRVPAEGSLLLMGVLATLFPVNAPQELDPSHTGRRR